MISREYTIILMIGLIIFELMFKFSFRILIIGSYYRGKSKRTLLKCNFFEKLFFKDIKFLGEDFQFTINLISNIILIFILIGCVIHLIIYQLIISNIFRMIGIIYLLITVVRCIITCYHF